MDRQTTDGSDREQGCGAKSIGMTEARWRERCAEQLERRNGRRRKDELSNSDNLQGIQKPATKSRVVALIEKPDEWGASTSGNRRQEENKIQLWAWGWRMERADGLAAPSQTQRRAGTAASGKMIQGTQLRRANQCHAGRGMPGGKCPEM